MTGPLVNSELKKMFPSNPNVSLDFVSGNIEILGKQIDCSPRHQSLSVKYYSRIIISLKEHLWFPGRRALYLSWA